MKLRSCKRGWHRRPSWCLLIITIDEAGGLDTPRRIWWSTSQLHLFSQPCAASRSLIALSSSSGSVGWKSPRYCNIRGCYVSCAQVDRTFTPIWVTYQAYMVRERFHFLWQLDRKRPLRRPNSSPSDRRQQTNLHRIKLFSHIWIFSVSRPTI